MDTFEQWLKKNKSLGVIPGDDDEILYEMQYNELAKIYYSGYKNGLAEAKQIVEDMKVDFRWKWK